MIDLGRKLQNAYDDGYKARDKEIVRCKDCIYGDTNEMGLKLNNAIRCNIHDDGYEMHEPDWFCADGERKSE